MYDGIYSLQGINKTKIEIWVGIYVYNEIGLVTFCQASFYIAGGFLYKAKKVHAKSGWINACVLNLYP